MLKLDGYDDACIGTAEVWQRSGDGAERIFTYIYSAPKIIDILLDRDGMSLEDAYEFLDFNIVGAYVGPNTPIIMWPAHIHEES